MFLPSLTGNEVRGLGQSPSVGTLKLWQKLCMRRGGGWQGGGLTWRGGGSRGALCADPRSGKRNHSAGRAHLIGRAQ